MRRLMIIVPALLAAGCAANPSGPVVIPLESRAAVPVRPMSTGLFAPDSMGVPGAMETVAEGTFEPKGTTAMTYDPAIVPSGATATVAMARVADGMQVRLAVTGMRPLRTYGAHLHTKPCATDPKAAGPHYQHNADPKAAASPPSVDPSYANPGNEVWLDLTTDARGAATAASVQDWEFGEVVPRSLILHAERTRTADGVAGTAGARVACLTLSAT